MAKIAYSRVVDLLLERFPEFMETEGFEWIADDLEFPYAVWGGFADHATTYMRRLPMEELEGDQLVDRVFDFANEMMDRGDDDVQTIVVVEMFEHFFMYAKTLELARRRLKPEHLTWLNGLDALLGTSDLHYRGELVAPDGIESLGRLLSDLSWEIRVWRPQRDAPPRLESNDDRVDLQMDPAAGPHFAFFGDARAWTDEAEARRLLGELSERLRRGGLAHWIGLYRTGTADALLEEFRHRWPDGAGGRAASGP